MHRKRTWLRAALALGVACAAGCGEPDPTEPGDDDDPPGNGGGAPVTLPVLGHGAVPERFTAEVAVLGSHAYTTTWSRRAGTPGDAVKVWDISGASPRLVDTLLVAGAVTLGDVQVSDDGTLLVVATEFQPGSIVIYELTNPARPEQVARFTSPSTNPGVHTVKLGRVGGRLYAFLSVDPAPAQLVVVDLTDPASPQEVLALPMGQPFVHDVFVRDGLLFTALWHDGVAIWDIGGAHGGSPSNPVKLGQVMTVGGAVHNIWWFHDPATGSRRYAFVGEEQPNSAGAESAGDIHVVDVSDPTDPREVAFFTVAGAGTHNFSMDEASGILYAAYYNGGVRALDVRGDLGTCEAAARAPDGRCDLGLMGREAGRGLVDGDPVSIWGVHFQDGRVYASDMLSGLYVLDARALVR